jgi:hypothetical protein
MCRIGNSILAAVIMLMMTSPISLADRHDVQQSWEREAFVNSAVNDWLHCEECVDSELEIVTKLGNEAVPALSKILEAAKISLENPPLRDAKGFQFEQIAQQLSRQWRQSKHITDSLKLSEQQYVELYLGNILRVYQARAHQALVNIGTPQAFGVLEELGIPKD